MLQQLCAHVLRVYLLAAAVGVHDGHEFGPEHHHKTEVRDRGGGGVQRQVRDGPVQLVPRRDDAVGQRPRALRHVRHHRRQVRPSLFTLFLCRRICFLACSRLVFGVCELQRALAGAPSSSGSTSPARATTTTRPCRSTSASRSARNRPSTTAAITMIHRSSLCTRCVSAYVCRMLLLCVCVCVCVCVYCLRFARVRGASRRCRWPFWFNEHWFVNIGRVSLRPVDAESGSECGRRDAARVQLPGLPRLVSHRADLGARAGPLAYPR